MQLDVLQWRVLVFHLIKFSLCLIKKEENDYKVKMCVMNRKWTEQFTLWDHCGPNGLEYWPLHVLTQTVSMFVGRLCTIGWSPCSSWSGRPPPCWPGPAPCTGPGRRPRRAAGRRPPAPGRACRPDRRGSPRGTASTYWTRPRSRLCRRLAPYLGTQGQSDVCVSLHVPAESFGDLGSNNNSEPRSDLLEWF